MEPSKISKQHYPETDLDSSVEKVGTLFPNFRVLKISWKETDPKLSQVPLGQYISQISEDYQKQYAGCRRG